VACDAQKLVVLTSIAAKTALQTLRGTTTPGAETPFLNFVDGITPFFMAFVQSFASITCQLLETPCLSCDCLHLIICLLRQLNALTSSISASLTTLAVALPTVAAVTPFIDQVTNNTQTLIVLFEKLRPICLRAENESSDKSKGAEEHSVQNSKVGRAVTDSLGAFYNALGNAVSSIASATPFSDPATSTGGLGTGNSIAVDLGNITGDLFNLSQTNSAESPNCRLPFELAQDFCSLASSLNAIAAMITIVADPATDDLLNAALATAFSASLSQFSVCLLSRHGKFPKGVSHCRDISTTCRFLPLTIAVATLEQDIPAAVADFAVTFLPAACAPFFPQCNPLCRLTVGRCAAP
jgi:hypothetical protein